MCDVLVVNCIGNNEALCCDAGLTGIHHPRFHPSRERVLEFCARHHDKRIAAAELEHALFQFASSGARYRTTGALASSKRDRFHSRILDDFFDGLILDQQGLKNSVFKSGITKNIFNSEGALRNVGRVLEQADIAGHQSRSGKSEDLPEGKIPWHNRENDPERLVADEASRSIRGDALFGQKFLAVLCIIAATTRAFLNFLD